MSANVNDKKIIVLQHIAVEHPGIFRDFMEADGISWDAIELDEGDHIPVLDDYDGMLVMGGPMDVWQEDEHPWLRIEKESIREAVLKLKMPYLGFCLGHQLLADALGGEVGPMSEPEVGILNVDLTEAGQQSAFFADIPKSFNSLQWHGAEVKSAPPGGTVLAESPACPIQALQVGESAFSIQCHVELTDKTVDEWGQVPEYKKSLEQTLGPGSLQKLDQEATENMPDFNRLALQLYKNFIQFI